MEMGTLAIDEKSNIVVSDQDLRFLVNGKRKIHHDPGGKCRGSDLSEEDLNLGDSIFAIGSDEEDWSDGWEVW